jgi:DNA polymerase (family 10)
MCPLRTDTRVASGAASLQTNSAVADSFDEMAELLAIEGENPFRVRAYQRAALVIRTLPEPLAEWRRRHELDELPGIGADLAKKIGELLDTGALHALELIRRRVPPGLRALLQLPGLGPVRVRALYASLGVCDVDGLRRAIDEDRLAMVRGFGPVLRERLRAAVGAPNAQLR